MMGWNKQSGDAWVLQRTAHFDKGKHDKALQLQLLSPLLSIEDAEKLMQALAGEIVAAFMAEKPLGITMYAWQKQIAGRVYGNAVLAQWRDELGPYEAEKVPPANLEDDDGCPND
jgi:hypothetical protein